MLYIWKVGFVSAVVNTRVLWLCYAVCKRNKQYLKCKMLHPALCKENSNTAAAEYKPSLRLPSFSKIMIFTCLLFLSQRDVVSFFPSLKRLSICMINIFLAYCKEEYLLHSGTQADSPSTALQTNIRTIYVCNKKKSCWFWVWVSCWHFRNCFRLFLIFRQTNMFAFLWCCCWHFLRELLKTLTTSQHRHAVME